MNEDGKDRTGVGMLLEKGFIAVVREFVRLIVLGLWSLIGLFFWIPLLARMVVYFTWSVVLASFAGSDVGSAQSRLDRAIRFYVVGFKNINHAVSKGPVTDASAGPLGRRFLWGILPDIAFSVVFWTVLGLLYGMIMIDIPRISTFATELIDSVKTLLHGQKQ